MRLESLSRFGTIPFVAFAVSLVVLFAVALVAGFDLLIKSRVLPVDLLIGGLTGLVVGPVFVYIPFQLGHRVGILRAELDEANLQLRKEAESLRQLSAELSWANQRLGFSQSLARIAYYEVELGSGRVTGSPELFALFPAGTAHPPTLADWHQHVHPDDRNAFDALFDRCTRTAEPVELDFRLGESDDSERWLHLYGEFAPRPSESPSAIVGVVQDISDLRKAEGLRRANERLLTDNAALAQADRLKDEFLATMSHELRTPLTGVLSLSEALQEEVYGPLTERQRHSLSIIESSGRHLLRLINDILDLAKIRSGKADVELENVSLCDVCRPALAAVLSLAADKGLEIVDSQGDGQVPVLVDPLRFRQILLNLLANAIKFTPSGGRIGVEFSHAPGSPSVCCTVWDTGVGIAPEDLVRLFKPFVQLDSTLARRFGGAGLGLCLAQRLAELQGGHITVTSAPGAGSRFTVHLPLGTSPPIVPGESLAGHRVPALDGSTGRVLVVDDDEINSDIYREYLEGKGYTVTVAADGAKALAVAAAERPDVIIMDVQMPVMDGLEAMRRLRAMDDPRLATTPVIALSALAMPGDEQRCLEAGCDTYLSKPVRLDGLLRSLNAQLLRRRSASAESSVPE